MKDIPSTSSVPSWRRPLLGCLALGLLLMGVLLHRLGNDSAHAARDVWEGACFKSSIVLALMWIALPQIDGLSHWAVLGTTGGLLLVAARPQALWVLVRLALVGAPLFALIWLLRPRRPRRGRQLVSVDTSAYIANRRRDGNSSAKISGM